jgi:hypothetical protein
LPHNYTSGAVTNSEEPTSWEGKNYGHLFYYIYITAAISRLLAFSTNIRMVVFTNTLAYYCPKFITADKVYILN